MHATLFISKNHTRKYYIIFTLLRADRTMKCHQKKTQPPTMLAAPAQCFLSCTATEYTNRNTSRTLMCIHSFQRSLSEFRLDLTTDIPISSTPLQEFPPVHFSSWSIWFDFISIQLGICLLQHQFCLSMRDSDICDSTIFGAWQVLLSEPVRHQWEMGKIKRLIFGLYKSVSDHFN